MPCRATAFRATEQHSKQLAWNNTNVFECARNTPKEGKATAEVLFDHTPDLTALLCMSDRLALGALDASRLEQLHDNLASLDVSLTPEQLQTLNEASAHESAPFFTDGLKRLVFGNTTVQGWR